MEPNKKKDKNESKFLFELDEILFKALKVEAKYKQSFSTK